MLRFAPIVLFVYNRPEHTKRTVEALLCNDYAKESELIIFADGAKVGATEKDIENIRKTRQYCYSISGFKNVVIHEESSNKGLDPSEIDGISMVINQYGRVIVVEDDLITNRFFLRFMNEALDFYENDKRIYEIAGYADNIQFPVQYIHQHSIWASYRVESWGWATWKDRWENNQWDEKKYDIIKFPTSRKIKKFNRGGEDLYGQLLSKLKGETDAWDIRWQHCLNENDGLCIRPIRSLVYNIGFDGTGVHCGVVDRMKLQEIKDSLYGDIEYNIKLEENIQLNYLVQRRLQQFFAVNRGTLLMSFKEKIKKYIRKLNM